MTALAAWSLSVALSVDVGAGGLSGQTVPPPSRPALVSEQERLQLARQRAAMFHALQRIQAEESVSMCNDCIEGLHAHMVLLLVDRGLGTKHACKVPREWLEGQR